MTPPFAEYLAQRFVSDMGYRPGLPLRLADLASGVDFALHFVDEFGASIVLIVDGTGPEARAFSTSGPELAALGEQFADELQAAGASGPSGAGFPVMFRILEVCREQPGPETRARLRALVAAMPSSSRCAAIGFALHPPSGRVVATPRWDGLFRGRRQLEGWMRGPRVAGSALAEKASAAARLEMRRPWATYALLLTLGLCFGGELFASVYAGHRPSAEQMYGPDLATLIVMGGCEPWQIWQQGEWWRMLSAALLHGNLVHIALNSFALWMSGRVVEAFLGRTWLLAAYVLAAMGGSALGIFVNPEGVVSVGASGAIMGLLALAGVLAQRLPPGPGRQQLRRAMLGVLVPSLLPLVADGRGPQIDYAAHAGGAVVGLLLGLALLRNWPRSRAEAPGGLWARVVLAGSAAMLCFSLYEVSVALPELPDVRRMILEAQAARPMPPGEILPD